MARRKITTRGITKVAMDGAKVYIGIAAGKALVNNVGILQQNPIVGIGAQVVLALMLGGGQTAPIALGLASNAVSTAANTFAPGLTSSLGISGLGVYGSTNTPGVTGIGSYNTPLIKVS